MQKWTVAPWQILGHGMVAVLGSAGFADAFSGRARVIARVVGSDADASRITAQLADAQLEVVHEQTKPSLVE